MISSLYKKMFLAGILLAFVCTLFATPITISFTEESAFFTQTTVHAQTAGKGALSAQSAAQAAIAAREASAVDPFSQMGHWLGVFFLTLGGAVAGMGGMFFDLAVDHLVLKMGHYIVEGGIGEVVNAIWGIVRDVVNLAFIFGFVYIGLKTILDPSGSGYRKFLAQLVIAALLVNFSLFFVKVVIDVANVTSIEVSQLMRTEGGNLGTAFATEMGMSNWYGGVDGKTLENLGGGGAAPAFYIMATLLLIIVGVTFAAAAFMIVIRFVFLILFMIGSPLYFAAMVFPQAAKFTKFSIPTVLGYAFYPAIFLFLMYVSLQILGTSTWSGQGNQLAQLFAGEQIAMTNFTVILQFSVAIALIIISMRVAKSMSMWGAGAIVGTSEKVLGNVLGTAPKYVLGGAGRRFSERIGDMQKSADGHERFVGTVLKGVGAKAIADSASKAKFGTGTSRADDYKELKERKRGIARNERLANIDTRVKAGIGAPSETESGEDQTNAARMKSTVRGASTEQLVEMFKEYKKDTPEYDALVSNMSSEQVSNVMKSKDEELDDAAKANVGKRRKKILEDKFADGAGVNEVFDSLQPKDIAKLPRKILVHPTTAPKLTAAALKAIADADALEDPVDRQAIRDAITGSRPADDPAVKWLNSPGGAIF